MPAHRRLGGGQRRAGRRVRGVRGPYEPVREDVRAHLGDQRPPAREQRVGGAEQAGGDQQCDGLRREQPPRRVPRAAEAGGGEHAQQVERELRGDDGGEAAGAGTPLPPRDQPAADGRHGEEPQAALGAQHPGGQRRAELRQQHAAGGERGRGHAREVRTGGHGRRSLTSTPAAPGAGLPRGYDVAARIAGREETIMRRLGDLEAEIMDRLWKWDRPATVREVVDDINKDRELAYTTVMTVANILYQKGWLLRTKQGRAWLYTPVRSREAYSAALMEDALGASEDRSAALAHFVEGMTDDEVAALRKALRDAGRRGDSRGPG